MIYYRNEAEQVFAYSKKDIDTCKSLSDNTPQVFHDIAEKLKTMVELTPEELDLHLNPPPTAEQVRAQRDGLLVEIDAYASNPLRWSETSDSDKALIVEYRQLLLDVPQQAGFPLEIEWPIKPSTLG